MKDNIPGGGSLLYGEVSRDRRPLKRAISQNSQGGGHESPGTGTVNAGKAHKQ